MKSRWEILFSDRWFMVACLLVLITSLIFCYGLHVSGCDLPDAQVSGDSDYVQVSAGAVHSCGLKEDGALECWGCLERDYGQCLVPDGKYTQVSAGLFHTCAINDIGKIICFGCIGEPLFGVESNQGQCNPPGYAVVDSLSCNWAQSCILDNEEAVCWGTTDIF